MQPVVDRLGAEFQGEVEFRLYNFDRDPDAASQGDRFGVQYVPTFIFMDSAGNQVDTRVGSIDEDEFRSILDSLQ